MTTKGVKLQEQERVHKEVQGDGSPVFFHNRENHRLVFYTL
ncbi:hypothetical protein FTV88_3368 [Heliorestis convoluta]|uniref:Uncharacterized protein n=1 Tax=Heliorestis convoluta TaxID=356322 RepID=A0A5Q2N661_9FIRM|nr:hypothetical protein FTV88_3368 [Heliorestis convoluta]